MKPPLPTLLALWGLTLVTAAFAEAGKDDAQNVFARVSPAVVTVRITDDKGGDDGQGSGVVIAPGVVATNCHVVREASGLRVSAGGKDLTARWVRQDPRRDVCLLAVDGLSAPAVGLRASAGLVVGEPVFAVGNPLGFGLAVSAGLIAAVDRKDGAPLVVSTAAQSPGSSGGGLFDRQGRLVGITTAILGTGQNLNLALSADGLDRLAATGGLPPPAAPTPAPEPNWKKEAIALQGAGEWVKLAAHARAWRAAMPSAAAAPTFLGLAQQVQGQDQEAAASLREAIDRDDHYPFAWLNYGKVLKRLGRAAEAEEALARAEALTPNYHEPPAARAEWLWKEGRLDDARKQIKESLRRDPSPSSSWRLLGVIEEARGDASEAVRAFQTAVRLGEANVDTGQRLAKLLVQAGNADEASRVAGRGKDESAKTQLAIGIGELQRKRLGPAEDALRKAVAIAPDMASAWSGLGSVLVASGRAAEGEKAYDQALKLSPDDAETLANRALARREQGRRQEAIEDARRAIAVSPEFVNAWRLYGALLAEAKNPREAAMAFGKVDGWGKATVEDLVSLGESLAAMGNPEAGLKVLARAEALDARHLRVCLSTAKVLGNSGQIDKALTYLERALKLDPTSRDGWSSKGYGLMKLGRLPEAVEALETTVRLAPDFPNGWINLGEAQLRSKNLGRAIQALEKATTLAPEALDARTYLAQAYLGARLPAKSREQAEWILLRQPAFVPALGTQVMAYLMEGNVPAAKASFIRMKAVAPDLARRLREQAIATGLPVAKELPD